MEYVSQRLKKWLDLEQCLDWLASFHIRDAECSDAMKSAPAKTLLAVDVAVFLNNSLTCTLLSKVLDEVAEEFCRGHRSRSL